MCVFCLSGEYSVSSLCIIAFSFFLSVFCLESFLSSFSFCLHLHITSHVSLTSSGVMGTLSIYKVFWSGLFHLLKFFFQKEKWNSSWFWICVRTLFVCVYMYASFCWHMCAGAHGGLRRACDLVELEWGAVMNCLMWVLGTEFRSFRRVASVQFLQTEANILICSPLIIQCGCFQECAWG